jgi:hypothetical protein
MSAIHFYRRYDPDGRCKVICMQCFQTLGTAWDRQSLEEMEAGHMCSFRTEGTPPPDMHTRMKNVRSEPPLLRDALQMNILLLALLTVLLLYFVPTALELGASHVLNPWLAVILPGDVIGCAALVALLRMPRTGILLYLGLTAIEGLSYAANGALLPEVRWFADLIPTLLVLTLLLRSKLRSLNLGVY